MRWQEEIELEMSLISKEDNIFEGDQDLFEMLRDKINRRLSGVLSDHRQTAEKSPFLEREIALQRRAAKKFTGRDIATQREKIGD